MNNVPPRRLVTCAAACAWLLAAGNAPGAPLPPLDCVTAPARVVEVASAASGLLHEVHVDRGDRVSRGMTIATLESSVETSTVRLARARAAMRGELESQQVNVDFDQRKYDRASQLHSGQAISAQLKEDAERDAALARTSLQHAREKRQIAALELAHAESLLARRIVTSPLDGVVTQRFRSPGEYVEDQPIVRVAKLDPLHVELLAPVELAGSIAPGMVADVVLEAGEQREVSGVVVVADPVADAASGTFGVRIEVANPEHRLMAGLKCRSTIDPGRTVPVTPSDPEREATPAPEPAPVESAPVREPARAAQFVTAASAPPVLTLTSTAPAAGSHAGPGSPGQAVGQSVPAPAAALVATATSVAGADSSAREEGEATDCASFGPLSTAAEADAVQHLLAERGLQPSRRQETTLEASSYFVLAGPGRDLDDARRIAQTLAGKGVRDLIVMRRGDFARHVSLGVYNALNIAETRSRALAERGIETVIRPRGETTTGTQWWLELSHAITPQQMSTLADDLRSLAPDVQVRPAACVTRVASRGDGS